MKESFNFKIGQLDESVLDVVLGLPFSINETNTIVQYCKKNTKQSCKDFLIVFLLLRHRRIEAIQFYDEMNKHRRLKDNQTQMDILMANVRRTLSEMDRLVLESRLVDAIPLSADQPLSVAVSANKDLNGRSALLRQLFRSLENELPHGVFPFAGPISLPRPARLTKSVSMPANVPSNKL
jgi:hypothetical protein